MTQPVTLEERVTLWAASDAVCQHSLLPRSLEASMSMPNSKIATVVVTLATGLLFAACPEDDACNEDGDCFTPDVCRAGSCVFPDDGAEGEGNEGEGEGNEEPVDGGFVPGPDGGVIPAECSSTEQLALYERRIEPLVSGDVPNSCAQCHFEGVSLASYVQDTPCQTMACLIESGEVDLANPEGSAILARILNAEPDSALITDEVIQAEHDGFLEWIEWSAICQDGVCGEIENPCNAGGGSPPPPDVLSPLGGCDETALVASFNQKVFAERGRCNSCHSIYGQGRIDDPEANGDAPLWIDGASNNPDSDDARNTMYNVIGRGLLNAADPPASLLVLKPQNLPEEPHGGGAKFENTSDATYLSFLSWIRDD